MRSIWADSINDMFLRLISPLVAVGCMAAYVLIAMRDKQVERVPAAPPLALAPVGLHLTGRSDN
jgi:hypothetical protein